MGEHTELKGTLPYDYLHLMEDEAYTMRRLDPQGHLWKLVANGKLLTERQHAVAVACSYFKPGAKYGHHHLLHYKDDENEHILCPEVADASDGGKVPGLMCGWGIHACHVKLEYLTPEQIEWFKGHGWTEEQFGTGDVAQVPANAK